MVTGSKPSVSEEVIRYQARTKLASLSDEISAIKKLKSPEALTKIKQGTMIRLWLKALDYKYYLSREKREAIWYALIGISGINDLPSAPILELRTRPNVLVGGTTTTTIINSQSESGKITFINSDVDTGTEIVDSFPVSFSPSAKWVYNARKNDGSAQITGEISATWLEDGSEVVPRNSSTIFAGVADITEVSMDVVYNDGDIELRATVATDDWTIDGWREHIPGAITGIVTTNILPTNHIIVGNVQAVAVSVNTSAVGDVLADSVTGLTIKAGVIVNADISASAGIVYTKLSLTDSIVNADIASAAAIGRTKIASGTAYRILANNVSGVLSENAALTSGGVIVADANGQLTTGAGTMGGALAMGSNKITGLAAATANGEAVRYEQLVGKIDGGLVEVSATTYTVLAANIGKIHNFTSSSARTVTLPLASTVSAGFPFWLKDASYNAATNNVTVNRSGSNTFEDGSTSAVLTSNGELLGFYTDGVSKWFAI